MSSYRGGHGGGRGGFLSHHNKRPFHDDRGRGGGGGRGGGQGGGRGGGGRGRGYGNTSRPTECDVFMNYMALNVIDTTKEFDIVMFKVVIQDAEWVDKVDPETGAPIINPATDKPLRICKPREIKRSDDDEVSKRRFFAKPIPWRIMKKLVSDQVAIDPNFVLDYDGAERAIAPSNSAIPKDGAEYAVCVKRDCEEDDPDADRVKNRRFFVTLTKTHSIPFATLRAAISGGDAQASGHTIDELAAAINIILKSTAIFQGMIPLSPQSSAVAFPLAQQSKLSNNRMIDTFDKTKVLLSGVTQSAIFSGSAGHGAYIQTDPVVEWFDKEYFRVDGGDDRNRVPLLRKEHGRLSIAGVDIGGDGHHPITDATLLSKIESALSKIRINIYYTIRKIDEKREQALRDKGLSEKERNERRRKAFKDQALSFDKDAKSKGHKMKILRSASDPDVFSFEMRDGERVTVASYYWEKYGIGLEYPNLPLIYLGRPGWFPIEFAHQSFAKTREANAQEMIDKVLKYYDGIAGTRLSDDVINKQHALSTLIDRNGVCTSERLGWYNISIESKPIVLKARVLKEPTIKFQGNVRGCKNGSFNLMGVVFPRGATINSFVVVDFSHKKGLCEEYVDTLLRVSESHGIQIPSLVKEIGPRHATVHYNGRNAVDDSLEVVREAIEKARHVYLRDSEGVFRGNHVWFQTRAFNEKEIEVEALILPPQDEGGPEGLILEYNNNVEYYYTHRIQTEKDMYARLMVRIKETETLIDPFDFRFQRDRLGGHHQALKRFGNDERWMNVTFVSHVYQCKDKSIVEVADVKSFSYVYLAKDWDVDFPSLILAFLPDADKAMYDRIKYVSNICGGIQSQCAVAKKYSSQGNRKDQYASNIAIKINTKLSTGFEKAVAWESSFGGNSVDAVAWVGECPTLVIGIGMAHGMGASSDTVVSAYTNLDAGCMRLSSSCFVQAKQDVITDDVMKDIFQESLRQYCNDNGFNPKRILVYRDGMSDGNFTRADDEIASIRKVFQDPNCKCKAGCVCCNPPITYIICQSQHHVRMVPSNESQGFGSRGGTNVHAGTVLDHTIMQLGTKLRIADDDVESIRESNGDKVIFGTNDGASDDFFLTAHGGLKGTSKPIYYRVRLNENAVWGPRGGTALTKQNIEDCTNQMSYKYGTATKAVRDVPVVKYSKRLSNQVLGQLKYLREVSRWPNRTYELVQDRPDDEGDRRSYLKVTKEDGTVLNQYNIVEMPFRNHLAA